MGLAERRRHPADRRKRAVYLTARGRRTLDSRPGRGHEDGAGDLRAARTPEELETLRLLLRKLAGVES